MGGSVSPNPSLLSQVIWEVDSWNGGDLNLESIILAGRLSKKLLSVLSPDLVL
jgi:hypothetical protein